MGYHVGSFTAQTTFVGTVLEVRASSEHPLEVIRGWISQRNYVTSEQLGVQLVRKTCGTLGTTGDLLRLSPTESTTKALIHYTITSEGTTGDLLIEDGFNNLTGWSYFPVPEERITISPSSFLAMKLTVAPSTGTFSFGFVVREI